MQSIDLAMGGLDISNIPKNWRPYATQRTSAWNRAKPVTDLERRYPGAHDAMLKAAKQAGVGVDALRFLPLCHGTAAAASSSRRRMHVSSKSWA